MIYLAVKDESEKVGKFQFASDVRVTIGRRHDSDICLNHPAVSAEHAFIYTNFATFIQDNGSTNGTFVKGRRVSRTVLMEGDDIQIGPYSIRFSQTENVEKKQSSPEPEKLDKTMIFTAPKIEKSEPAIIVLSGANSGAIISLNEPFVTLGEPGKHAALIMKKAHGFAVSQITSSSQNPGELPTINGKPLDDLGKSLSDQDVIHVAGQTHKFVENVSNLKTTY